MQGRGRGVCHGRLAAGVYVLARFACHSEESASPSTDGDGEESPIALKIPRARFLGALKNNSPPN